MAMNLSVFGGNPFSAATQHETKKYSPDVQSWLINEMDPQLSDLFVDGLDQNKIVNFIASHDLTQFKSSAIKRLEQLCVNVGLTLQAAITVVEHQQNRQTPKFQPNGRFII